MISGRFNYAAGVLTAFRAPGMTREKVAQVSEIVSDAVKGEISADEAVQRAANVHSSLGAFLRAAHERGITFDRVLAVILAIYTFWTQYSSDADVQAALEELHSQTEIARKQDERSEKLLLELQEQNSTLRELATKSVSPQPGRTQTNGTKNRYERRKAAAIERRTKRGRE